jgi:hypothetical protein
MAQQLRLKFIGLTLDSIKRDRKKGTASVSCNLTEKVIDALGWYMPADWQTSVACGDTVLAAQHVIFGMSGTLTDAYEIQIDAQAVGKFTVTRMQTKGKRGASKGYRHVLGAEITFSDPDALAHLDAYMRKVPEGKGTMTVLYVPQAVQGEMQISDVTATEEQRQAVLKEE